MCPFIVRCSCCLEKTKSAAQNRIVNWGGRSKFITKLSKSIWQRWKFTTKPKIRHEKLQYVNKSSKARLKLLTKNFNESLFTVESNERQQQSYYESEDHPATEDVIPNKHSQDQVSSECFVVAGCQWASVSESVFFTAGLTVNKKLSTSTS
jgi:hypothetical protein